MEFIDLSKGAFPKSLEEAVQFKSSSLVAVLGDDPFNQVGGFLVPSKDENHQVCIVNDFRDVGKGLAKIRLYKRQRENVDSKWSDWLFAGTIE